LYRLNGDLEKYLKKEKTMNELDTISKTTLVESIPAPRRSVNLSDLVRLHASTVTKMLARNKKADTNGNCCCCCCDDDRNDKPSTATCSVDRFDVNQELGLDPNSFGVPGGPTIISTRANISWSVAAKNGATVTVQIRTRGLDGNPAGPFAEWQDTKFVKGDLIDQVRFAMNDFLGTKVEFRIVVRDPDGNTLCISAPDS
jgi:hypothetical protein